MFVILAATKPLNDGTAGFRFNILNQKGLYRKRKIKSRPLSVTKDTCMVGLHWGKRSLYLERRNTGERPLFHFAG
jgi:hypothetical protein